MKASGKLRCRHLMALILSILARLHRDSVSPTGMFGFPVPTYKGHAPVNNEWCDRWEDWFARQFRMDVQFEQSVRGPDPEMDGLLEEFVAKVIPRLLRPLQTGGRSIKPGLVHTDIWHGNIHRDRASQEPIVFDACCVYGHHESKSPPRAWCSLDGGYTKYTGSGAWDVQRTAVRMEPGVLAKIYR